MLINQWNIEEAKARQMNVTIGHHSVSTKSEWSQVPVFLKNNIGFKTVTVILAVHGENRADIIHNRSLILSRLLEPVELALDGYGHKFYGILSKQTSTERSKNRWHNLQLDFNCYEYGETVATFFEHYTGEDTDPGRINAVTFNNDGDIETPVRLEIMPLAGATSITLTGICRDDVTDEDLPVTIKNIETGKTVVLDGETGLITQGEETKVADVDLWKLPSLKPGVNKVTVDNDWMDIKIVYKPRYM